MKKTAVWVTLLGSLAFAGGDLGGAVEPEVAVPMMAEESTGGFYIGLGAGYQLTYSTDSDWVDTANTQDKTVSIVALAGYTFNPYIAVEGRISQTVTKEDYADVFTYSLFVKPQYPVTESFDVYALLGFGGVTVEGADGEAPAHPGVIGEEIMDETGFQWGIGGSYAFTDALSVFADYTSLANDADISSTLYGYDPATYSKLSNEVVTVGVTYQF
ncbi:MAG: porin family protein [Campylobacterales bacterium]|nr:porin family protein [Campylobacterales bacterium]